VVINFKPDWHHTEGGDLFSIWTKVAYEKHGDGLIPIYWSVRGENIYETMPFQHEQVKGIAKENFLTYFTCPKDAETGEPLNRLT